MRVNRPTIMLSCAGVALVAIYALGNHFITSKVTVGAENAPPRQRELRLVPTLQYKDTEYHFLNVAVVGGGEVWAVGLNSHDPRRIYHSTDSGSRWEVIDIPSPGFTLEDISFPDAQNGWAVGGYGTIMHTSDGGKSWQQLKRPTEAALTSVTFVNDKVGYIGGSNALFDKVHYRDTYGVVIMRTTDGGQSWRTCYEDNDSKSVGQIAAFSETTAVVFLDQIIRTEDGGKTWQPISPPEASFHSITVNAEGIAYAVSFKGDFYRSVDKGKTWQKLTDLPETLLSRQWWSIDFADGIRGMAVGKNGAIASTDDGGKTWTEVKTDIQEDLMTVKLHGQRGLILSSQKVYQIAGAF